MSKGPRLETGTTGEEEKGKTRVLRAWPVGSRRRQSGDGSAQVREVRHAKAVGDLRRIEQLDPTVLAERKGNRKKEKNCETVERAACVTAKRRRTIMLSHLSSTVPRNVKRRREVRSAQRSTWSGGGEGGEAWKEKKQAQ